MPSHDSTPTSDPVASDSVAVEDPATLTAKRYYSKPHYLLAGVAGAVEWAGVHRYELRLHHARSPWGPQPDLEVDPDAYVDEGMACSHVQGDRCWPVVVPLADEAAAVLLAGDTDVARPILEHWYRQLQPTRVGAS